MTQAKVTLKVLSAQLRKWFVTVFIHARHAWDNDDLIDLNSMNVIDKGDFRMHLKESWHTAKNISADNISKPLPGQHKVSI